MFWAVSVVVPSVNFSVSLFTWFSVSVSVSMDAWASNKLEAPDLKACGWCEITGSTKGFRFLGSFAFPAFLGGDLLTLGLWIISSCLCSIDSSGNFDVELSSVEYFRFLGSEFFAVELSSVEYFRFLGSFGVKLSSVEYSGLE